MLKIKIPALIAIAVLAFNAQCKTTTDLQDLLKSNPVSDSDIADLGGMLGGNELEVVPSLFKAQVSDIEQSDSMVDDGVTESDITHALSSDRVALKPSSDGSLFVNNIPSRSTIKFGEKLLLTTNGTAMFFKNGGRVYSNPFVNDKFSTFCMLRFTKSSVGRRILPSSTFSISKVSYKTIDKKMFLGADRHIQLLRVDVDNADFKQIICYSGILDAPMTTGDMKSIIGSGLKINIEQYKDI